MDKTASRRGGNKYVTAIKKPRCTESFKHSNTYYAMEFKFLLCEKKIPF